MEDFMKHPLIMDPNHVPTQEEIEENQFLQSIQAMKYSEDDTPDEQAQAHKEDGTFHFKAKLYKKACIGYSKAISINPPNKTLLVREKHHLSDLFRYSKIFNFASNIIMVT